MLRSFNKGSAAGPTGIHTSQAFNTFQVNNQTSVLDTHTSFAIFLAKGNANSEVQLLLSMASVVLNEANEYFLPFECVSAKGGAEAVAHAWKSLFEQFDGLDLIGFKIDFDNVFFVKFKRELFS